MRIQIFMLAFISLAFSTNGQSQFANTLAFSESATSPNASLSSVQWMEGHWRGEAFGGITEEVWTPPIGGSMMCAFKLVVADKVKFYEMVTISEEAGTLILRLKHFHANMKGWEEKDKTIDFRLVKITEKKIYFDEFTIEHINNEKMNIYVVIDNKGKREEVKFSYSRM